MVSFVNYMFATFLCGVFLGGCATPIVTADGYFGIGLFVVDRECYGHEVVRTMITGVGVLTGTNSIAIGYSDRDFLVVPFEGRHYHVKTPVADLYVGDKSVEVAGPWAADYYGEVSGRKPRKNIKQGTICGGSSVPTSLANAKTKGGSE